MTLVRAGRGVRCTCVELYWPSLGIFLNAYEPIPIHVNIAGIMSEYIRNAGNVVRQPAGTSFETTQHVVCTCAMLDVFNKPNIRPVISLVRFSLYIHVHMYVQT